MSLKQKIRQKAYQLGFDLCGFTQDFAPQNKNYFLQWLEQKRFADMQWLGKNTDKRLQPQNLLEPHASSAIVLACSYALQPKARDYQLARYAHGEDYHIWMKSKIKYLEVYIKTILDEKFISKSFVDTGPVLERDMAAKAGLGWVGKNTNLLNGEKGSYLFLGVIFTNLDLAPDAPQADACLNCRLCIDACPTQALVDYQLNASQCLAYHNIEKRGPRDVEFFAKMQDWLVGCDICQEVCPYNHQPAVNTNLAWQTSFAQYDLGDLKNILQMTQSDYKAKTKHSAISRVKYEDFMRNVFIVVANANRVDLLPDIAAWRVRNSDLNLEELTWCLKKLS